MLVYRQTRGLTLSTLGKLLKTVSLVLKSYLKELQNAATENPLRMLSMFLGKILCTSFGLIEGGELVFSGQPVRSPVFAS